MGGDDVTGPILLKHLLARAFLQIEHWMSMNNILLALVYKAILCRFPVDQFIAVEPEGDLFFGSLNRVTSMKNVTGKTK